MAHTSTPFGLIFLLWGAGLGAAAQYAKVSVVFDQLPSIYPAGGVALGFLVSVVGFVGILFGVIAGLLVARIGYRRALIGALAAGAALSAIQALFPPLPIMLGLRVLEGASHLVIVVAAPTLIAQLSAARHRGFTLTLWSTFFGVSYTLLVWLGLPMVSQLGIASLFWVHAAWMAVFAVVLGPSLRAMPAQPRPDAISLRNLAGDHVTLYRSPFLAAPAIGWFFYTMCFLALLTLLPPFIDPAMQALVIGAMPLVSIVASMTLGVWLLRFVGAITVILTGFGACVLSLIWLWAVPGGPVACFVLAAALGLVQGASFAAVPQLNTTAEDQARANGAMAQMGNVGNTLGTPMLVAVIAGAGYSGMIVTAIVIFTSGLCAHLWLAHRRRKA